MMSLLSVVAWQIRTTSQVWGGWQASSPQISVHLLHFVASLMERWALLLLDVTFLAVCVFLFLAIIQDFRVFLHVQHLPLFVFDD